VFRIDTGSKWIVNAPEKLEMERDACLDYAVIGQLSQDARRRFVNRG